MIARKKRILIAVLIMVFILLAISGGIYAFLYFTTDTLKSDQELFYKYISKNVDIINIVDRQYYNNYTNKINTSVYNNSGELTFSVTSDLESENEESQLNTALNNVKIKFEGTTDKQNKKAYQDIKLLYSDEEKELFDVKFLREDEIYGLKTDEIVTKYVSVENNDIYQLYNKLGLENTNNIANKLEEYDLNGLLNMSEERKNSIKQRYMNVLNKQIPSSKFSKEKKSEVIVNNEIYVANKYSVKLTGDEFINVKIKLLEALLNDEETLQEFVKIEQKNDEYKKIIKGEIQEEIENIKRQPSNPNIALEINVYELDGNSLKTECIAENETTTIENINNGTTQNVTITNTQTDKGTIVTTYNLIRNTSESSNSIIFKLNTVENGRQASDVSIEIKNDGNLNSNNLDTSININIDDDTGKKEIKYTNKKQFGVSSQIDSLSENTVTLNNMTIEYNKSTIQAIKERLQSIYEERASSVGLNSETLTSEIKLAIKNMKEQFNRDEFEKQVQRSLNYIKQDALVDAEYIQKLQNAKTDEEKKRVKEERLVKRLVEFGIDAISDEENGRILIDSGYNYNYVYYIDYEKYTVTRAE